MVEREQRFGEWLREVRAKLGLSYQKAAKIAGVGSSTLFFTETGQTSPKIHTLLRIFEVLNCEVRITRAGETVLLKSKEDGEQIVAIRQASGGDTRLSPEERDFFDLLRELDSEQMARALRIMSDAFPAEKKVRRRVAR